MTGVVRADKPKGSSDGVTFCAVGGLGKQGKRKGKLRSADLTIAPAPATLPAWRPPPEECMSVPQTTMAPPDGSLDRDRIIVRMEMHAATDEVVEFAVIQQTKHQGSWQNVCSADSCHNTDVHLHRYGRSTGERVGEPEPISEIRCMADVGDGYDLAYVRVIDEWTSNKRRWRDG